MASFYLRFTKSALLSSVLMMASTSFAADVTPQRLLKPEPHNWLMNHRTYDGQRFSPLDKINKANVKGLRPFPDFAGKGRFAFGEQLTWCRLPVAV